EDQGAADLGGGAAANLVPEGEADRGGLRASAIGARGRVRGAAPRRGGDPFGCRWLGLALSSARGNQPEGIHRDSTRLAPERRPRVRLADDRRALGGSGASRAEPPNWRRPVSGGDGG